MRGSKFHYGGLLLILSLLLSCDKLLNKSENKSFSPGSSTNTPPSSFLPTDLKSIAITATQEDGNGFTISSIVANSNGSPTVEDGRINFKIAYETFSNSTSGLSLKTDIFSLVTNGFVNRSFATEDFNLMMEPGIYILTVTVKKGQLAYPPFKAKMVVKCSSTLQGNLFQVDPSKVQISPVSELFWSQKNRYVYFGRYQHNLSQVVTPPAGANLSLYSYNLDSNGDGRLEMINGVKVNRAGYGIDIINRNLFSSTIAYSTFADDERFLTYEVYDECYNSKSFEVSTGTNGIFGITEKEDLTSPDQRPEMSEIPLAPEDPSYMVYAKKEFLQQIQEETGASTSCEPRVGGGVNYPAGCDTRLTGTLSLIPVSNRSGVTCLINPGSLTIKAEEGSSNSIDGYNYNLIANYSVNIAITGITKKFDNDGYPYWDATNAQLNNYTFTIPGAGDAIGKDVLTTNNCSIEVLTPIQSRAYDACTSGYEGDGTFQTVQHVRVAYQCGNVTSTLGRRIKVAGELYCKSGLLPATKTDCVNPNPPTPAPPGNTPVPPPPPPPEDSPE